MAVDPFLIAPYRWASDPAWAWWLGTSALCLWCTLVGELTLGVAYRVNQRFAKERAEEMVSRHNQAMAALRAGDKEIYTGANKLANEAFGKAFFLQMAMGMSSLWPAFFGAAWLQERFAGLLVPVPFLNVGVRWLAAYVVLYILSRILFSRYLKKRLPFFRQTAAMARSLSSKQRLDLLSHGE